MKVYVVLKAGGALRAKTIGRTVVISCLSNLGGVEGT